MWTLEPGSAHPFSPGEQQARELAALTDTHPLLALSEQAHC